MSKELTAFSLFTGDGGMDVGFERAGIRVVFANELMKEAAQTYNANHPAGVMVNDDVNNVMDQLNEKKAIKLLETFEYKPENMPKGLIIFLKYSVFHFLNATI